MSHRASLSPPFPKRSALVQGKVTKSKVQGPLCGAKEVEARVCDQVRRAGGWSSVQYH